jgi:hypothetical protein
MSGVTSMYIDGDLWIADSGDLYRYSNGASVGWTATDPSDSLLRPAPTYTLVGSGSDRRIGTIYGFDTASDRLIGLSKVNGSFIAQYRLAAGGTGWSDLRGFYVEPGLDQEPDAIVWISKQGVNRVLLQPAGALGEPGASETPTAASPSP